MKVVNLTLAAALAVLLAGCLEVDQHPAYANGAYAGKQDNRSEDTTFRKDKAAQQAALVDRTKAENEYNRVKP